MADEPNPSKLEEAVKRVEESEVRAREALAALAERVRDIATSAKRFVRDHTHFRPEGPS